MKQSLIIVAMFASLFLGCTSDSDSGHNDETIENDNQLWSKMDTREGGYALQVFVPTSEIEKGETKIQYLEDLGELRVVSSENFDFSIFEDESQMNIILNEINNHPFYKVEIVEKTDSSLLYRFFLEDKRKDVWHFYTERSLGQPLLLIRSNQNVEFNEFYARKMLESSLKLIPLK
jgi:hypothetical protein